MSHLREKAKICINSEYQICKFFSNEIDSFISETAFIFSPEQDSNSAKVRIRNRCEMTGRPRGVYRKLRISRIALRELASKGIIPGMTKSSW